MKFFQETTKWDGDYANHIYLLTTDKSKMYGYIKHGTTEAQVFKKPIGIDIRGRTFREVKELGDINLDNLEVDKSWTVSGSKGDKYIVEKTDTGYNCSCSGFRFRGQCKHIESVKE
jgi:hypothetical protein